MMKFFYRENENEQKSAQTIHCTCTCTCIAVLQHAFKLQWNIFMWMDIKYYKK